MSFVWYGLWVVAGIYIGVMLLPAVALVQEVRFSLRVRRQWRQLVALEQAWCAPCAPETVAPEPGKRPGANPPTNGGQ